MEIGVTGATGTVGQRVVAEALSRGHQVTAVARDASRVRSTTGGAAWKVADVLDAASVVEAIAGLDVVVTRSTRASRCPTRSRTPTYCRRRPAAPASRPRWWWRLTHPRAARQDRQLAAHHAWTTERARQAQIDLVRAGFHLGPVPFGYQAHRVTAIDRDGQPRRRVRLVIDPGPATAVATIYRWRVDDRLSPSSIATRLNGLQDLFLLPFDPTTGTPRPWTSTAIGRVLANPVYTGATVWGRTNAGQAVPPDQWVICPHAHEPVIDGRTFYRAQLLAAPGTGIITWHLPAWEFSQDTPNDPENGNGSPEPTA